MNEVPRRILLTAAIILVIAAGAVFAWRSFISRQHAVDIASLRAQGTALWNQGRMQEARAMFEKGRDSSSQPDDKAMFEIFIASTYAQDNALRAVDAYLSVVNNNAYSMPTRSFAGALLLAFLENSANTSLTSYAFSKPPFTGLLRNDSKSEYINREVAYSRAHQLLLSNYAPNFLSYLEAGNIYAYLYPQVSKDVQALILPRIPEYFMRGRPLLNNTLNSGAVHSSIMAIGLREVASYAQNYASLVSNGLIKGDQNTPDNVAIEAYYRKALDYEQNPRNSVAAVTKLTTVLRYAQFLNETATSTKRADQEEVMRSLASYTQSLAADKAAGGFIRQVGATTITFGPYNVYRSALTVLAQYNPDLRTTLIDNGWTLTQKGDAKIKRTI